MVLPAIGSLSALHAGGRLGVAVDARPLAEPRDGRQLAALQLKTVDQRDVQGRAASRVSGLAPLPAEASERPGPTRRALATREERAALAPRPEQSAAAARAAGERLRQREAEVRQEATAHAAFPGDRTGPIEYVHQRGPDGRHDAVGDAVRVQATLPSGAPAELRRLAAAATAQTKAPAQDYATARLGLRLYAEAAEEPPPAPRVDLTS